MLLAAYICASCEVTGRTSEDDAGQARCWNCGEPAFVTAQVTPALDFSLLRASVHYP